jgi:hypothetical protein
MRPYLKKLTEVKRPGSVAQVAEGLSSKPGALEFKP